MRTEFGGHFHGGFHAGRFGAPDFGHVRGLARAGGAPEKICEALEHLMGALGNHKSLNRHEKQELAALQREIEKLANQLGGGDGPAKAFLPFLEFVAKLLGDHHAGWGHGHRKWG